MITSRARWIVVTIVDNWSHTSVSRHDVIGVYCQRWKLIDHGGEQIVDFSLSDAGFNLQITSVVKIGRAD